MMREANVLCSPLQRLAVTLCVIVEPFFVFFAEVMQYFFFSLYVRAYDFDGMNIAESIRTRSNEVKNF